MIALVSDAIITGKDINSIPNALSEIAQANYIAQFECPRALRTGWEQALDHFLEDSSLSESEEARLLAFANQLELTPNDLNVNGAFDRAIKAKILTGLCEGRVPIAQINGQLPFNFKKSEQPVYVFNSVNYYEERTRTTYVGRSQGVSVRVMKGIYYRVGAFKGTPVQTSQMAHVDNGIFAVTTESLYFQGNRKSFRIPYSKIVSFTQYSNGIGLHRDAASAKPQIFVTGDGWFTCNLIENLARIAEEQR